MNSSEPMEASGEADALRISEIRERIERGEDVVTLGMLRSMLFISGQQITAKDMRRMLRIAEPKLELKDYLFRILVCTIVGWVLAGWARGGDTWGGVVASAVAIWLAYSMGVSNGEKINPKPLDLFGRDMPGRR